MYAGVPSAIPARELLAACGFAQRLGHAEVHYERMATGQEDIIRLDVAMHHAMRVRVGKRIRDLDEDLHRIVDWELAVSREPVAQRLALDVRHDVIEETACFARVQQRQDVGVLKL